MDGSSRRAVQESTATGTLTQVEGVWGEMLRRDGDARGELVSDAVIGALAIEAGATVVTYDQDFARFPGLRWSRPFER